MSMASKMKVSNTNRRQLFLIAGLIAIMAIAAVAQKAEPKPGVMTADEVKTLTPATYFFRGQSATVQTRNTSGFAVAGGKLVLAGLVDTSGYSSAVQEKYQGLFITEVKLKIGAKTLAPGQYGFGFLADGTFLIQDVGANDLFAVPTMLDDKMKRPVPLKFVAEGGAYRLYAGKKFVTVKPE